MSYVTSSYVIWYVRDVHVCEGYTHMSRRYTRMRDTHTHIHRHLDRDGASRRGVAIAVGASRPAERGDIGGYDAGMTPDIRWRAKRQDRPEFAARGSRRVGLHTPNIRTHTDAYTIISGIYVDRPEFAAR
jgi:hypothetical protein